MYVRVDFKPEITEELEKYIKSVLPDAINEVLFADKTELNRMIKDAVKGSIRAGINDILQTKDFREFLRDKIVKEIGMEKQNEI